jgi:outer membrane murein-binding lipoprotein Lpp
MTGEGIALIITAVGTLLTAIASGTAVIIGALNTIKLNRTAADVRKIEVATNSMKDQLVAATATGAHAEGVAQGRADMTAERKAEGRGP